MIKKPFQEQLSKFSLLGELPKVENGLEETWKNLKKSTEPFTAQDIIRQQQETINRQQAEIEDARNGILSFKNKYESAINTSKDLQSVIKEKDAEIERLTNNKCEDCAGCTQWLCDCSNERAQAIKEYTEKLIFEIVNRPLKDAPDGVFYNNGRVDRQNEIIDIINELAGVDFET